MSRYYFLLCSLPSLHFNVPPEISFEEVIERISLNVSESDKERVKAFLSYIDLLNLKALWLGHPIDLRGNFTEKELDEALLVYDFFPEYLYDFLERYPERKEKVHFFPFLLNAFFKEERSGFLGEYFSYEREVRMLLAALRAKDSGREIAEELQFEDPHDPFIAYILAQKDMVAFEPPKEYEQIKILYKKYKESPKDLNKALLEMKFNWIDEKEQEDIFTIDQLLTYMAKLYLLEYWHSLTEKNGQIMMERMG